jgi:hypothetical protein
VFARVDLFLNERTGQLLFNGVNTIQGTAATSVFPKVMRAAGYTYPELLAELCRLAAQGKLEGPLTPAAMSGDRLGPAGRQCRTSGTRSGTILRSRQSRGDAVARPASVAALSRRSS